jgi:hypothetical protein
MKNQIEYPNKIYVIEWQGENLWGGQSHFCITVAGSDEETVKKCIKEQIGIKDANPVWLMNAVYPTIWTENGSIPEPVQFKVLFNGHYHVVNKEIKMNVG